MNADMLNRGTEDRPPPPSLSLSLSPPPLDPPLQSIHDTVSLHQ